MFNISKRSSHHPIERTELECIGVDCVIRGINGDYFTDQQWFVGYVDGGSIINCPLHLFKDQPEDGPTVGSNHVAVL